MRRKVLLLATVAAAALAPGSGMAAGGPPPNGDTGQFACSLLSASDLQKAYGLRDVEARVNGGDPPLRGQPAQSLCFADAKTAAGEQATAQLNVSIFKDDATARTQFAGDKQTALSQGGQVLANVGDGLAVQAGWLSLLHGNVDVRFDVETTGAAGHSLGTIPQAVAMGRLIDERFGKPAGLQAPPRPGKGDLDPCFVSTKTLQGLFGRATTKAPAFSDVPNTLQCNYVVRGIGTFWINTVTAAGLARRHVHESIDTFFDTYVRKTMGHGTVVVEPGSTRTIASRRAPPNFWVAFRADQIVFKHGQQIVLVAEDSEIDLTDAIWGEVDARAERLYNRAVQKLNDKGISRDEIESLDRQFKKVLDDRLQRVKFRGAFGLWSAAVVGFPDVP